MSKADELSKKMGQARPAVFTPRPSVDVKPIEKPKEAVKKPAADELVVLYAKIPKTLKAWVDHHKIDTGQELGDIVTEALKLLQQKAGRK